MEKKILRFTTAWSVDDWKSTLIWRLLYDTKSIFQDQYDTIKKISNRKWLEDIDLSFLTDWLKDEINQWITIDVAYRYFSTPERKFIIADTPGHKEYTKNMITWASTADLALILIDARKWIVEQTFRHIYIANLLNIKHIFFCINKMDLVNYSEKIFNDIKNNIKDIIKKLNFYKCSFLPISALKWDNIVNYSNNMNWYKWDSLIEKLENIVIKEDYNIKDARYPIQYVIRPRKNKFHDYRWYAGRIIWGELKIWDTITVLPSMEKSKIKSIELYKKKYISTTSLMSYSITLEDDIDLSRWSMIVKDINWIKINQDIEIIICWLNRRPLNSNIKYWVIHTTNKTRCIILNIDYKIDINTYSKIENDDNIEMNDLAYIKIKLLNSIFYDEYVINKKTWSIILIDEITNETVAVWFIQK